MKVIDGGRPQLHVGERVLVDGRSATVICPDFKTHVYRGMVSVRYPDGGLDLVESERVHRPDHKEVSE